MTTLATPPTHIYHRAIKVWSVFDGRFVGYIEKHGSKWRERGVAGSESDSLEAAKCRLVAKHRAEKQ